MLLAPLAKANDIQNIPHIVVVHRQNIVIATSGSSDIGDSGKIIQTLVPNAKVDAGKRFPSSVSTETLADWEKGK